ncbi:hypothetical protein FAZ19_16330 [Sphingobacterium alkalisoli]|uniref:Uncharacterized protein n=1 Tax=Sphingobacterium alkalisoli TaxID=1874115 RepID=A0A4U0GYQ0_9SPHI|nr:hypothetical protein [Sphingobacterium alkalisoli]TJY63834.1 hypothetical protein FAZ19_16330 [Sphingobacterium alkalisoli]GGH24570.1 hypothetical protein GCM10011418_32590 [Sphingobacterium alkalisoli]
MQEFIQEYILPNLWGALVGGIGAIWVYIRSKPRERIEQDGGIVDNAKKVLSMSEDIAERLEKQLIASDGVIQALKEKLRIAIEGENTCKKALKAIKEEYANFQLLFHDQKIELQALREECRLLRLAIETKENENNNIGDNLHLN